MNIESDHYELVLNHSILKIPSVGSSPTTQYNLAKFTKPGEANMTILSKLRVRCKNYKCGEEMAYLDIKDHIWLIVSINNIYNHNWS